MDGYNLVSLAGLFVLMGLAWALSTNRPGAATSSVAIRRG